MTNLKLALAAFVATTALAPAALADSARSSDPTVVKTSDLNLNNPADGILLLQRINDSADRICNDPRSVLRIYHNDCRQKLIASTVKNAKITTLDVAYRDAFPDENRLASR